MARSCSACRWNYDAVEIRADGAVHLASVLFAVVGGVVVVSLAFAMAPPLTAFGASVYAVCLVATLTLSALYNMWPVGPRKWLLRRFDHAGIFLLIAGTYTPFAVHMGVTGLRFLVGLWVAAAAGILLKIAFAGRYDRIAVLIYLMVGWSGLALYGLMPASLGERTTALIVAGGLVYSFGVVFHLWERLRFQNAIWHGFVLAGAACHYAAVLVSIFSVSSVAA